MSESRIEVRKLKHSISVKDTETGRILAEITFPETSDGVYDIDRTYVSESMRGQGLAAKLVEDAIQQIHKAGGRVTASCPYAHAWMVEHRVSR